MKFVPMAVALCCSALTANVFAADTYTIDPETSTAFFEVARVGFSSQRGSFKKTSGKVTLDFASSHGSVEFIVDTSSIDMGSPGWTAHLADEALFNVAKFPTMTFKSDKLIFNGSKVVAAEGKFTMLGVTQPLKVHVNHFHCGPNPIDKRQMCSGSITADLKRSAFGLTKYIPAASDEIAVSVSVDAYKN